MYCEEDEEAVYNIPFLDVQGANECHEDGEPRSNTAVHLTLLKDLCSINRCMDYILIDSEAEERTEICGNFSKDNTTFVNSNAFTVIFCSSESYSFTQGFQMRIACLGQESSCDMQGSLDSIAYALREILFAGCLDLNDFDTCWCECTGDCGLQTDYNEPGSQLTVVVLTHQNRAFPSHGKVNSSAFYSQQTFPLCIIMSIVLIPLLL